MKNLKAKLRRDGGFTLVEMLIVVAIIAILVAVSIPMIGTALEKTREATDAANLRAAKAEAIIMYMNAEMKVDGAKKPQVGWVYDNVSGLFVETYTGETYAQAATTSGDVIKITKVLGDATNAPANGEVVVVEWQAK